MLNCFKGRFRNGAAFFVDKNNFLDFFLLGAFFIFLLLLRFYDITFHGIWRDEVASLYFTRHLRDVLTGDSHSLFYYLLLTPVRFFSELDVKAPRIYQGLLGLGLYGIILFRSRKIFSNEQWLFFNSVYGVHPLVFGFSRLLRPYGLLIDLATLLIIECRANASKNRIFTWALFQSCIYPLSLIPLGIEFLVTPFKKVYGKLLLVAALPSIIYYGIKLSVDTGRFQYIGWIKGDPTTFFHELASMLIGSYYPYYQSLGRETGSFFFFILLLLMLVSVFITKSPLGKKNLGIFIGSFAFVFFGANFLSYVIDLRINRYYVFLFPYFLMAITYSLPEKRMIQNTTTLLVVGLSLYQTLYLFPYFTKQESFGDFVDVVKAYSLEHNHAPVLACGYTYHNWYFKMSGFGVCSNEEDLKRFAAYDGELFYAYINDRMQGLLSLKSRRVVSGMVYDNGKLLHMAGIDGAIER